MSQNATESELLGLDGQSDSEVAAQLSELLTQESDRSVRVLFFDEAVAALWRNHPRVDAVAWGRVLARQALSACPPVPLDRVAPPPVIVGDGPLAEVLLTELIAGWAEPGQLLVHCVGWDEAWAEEGAAWAGDAAEVSWLRTPLRPASVVRSVHELCADWGAPPPNRGTLTGPSVYVACHDEATGAVIAEAVAAAIPRARVVLLESAPVDWPVSAVTVLTRQRAVDRVLLGEATADLELAQLLFRELSWLNAPDSACTAHQDPLFEPTSYDGSGAASWQDQPTQLQDQYLLVAKHISDVLAAGGLTLRLGIREPSCVLLSPGELKAIAERLLTTLHRERSLGTWQAAVEVAARLPALAARAGYRVSRPVGEEPLLSKETLDDLASQVHWAYQQVSIATGNATGSPLANALWEGLDDFNKASNRAVITGSAVTYAVAGFDWERTHVDLKAAEPTAEELGRLGELEHRRWAIYVRRCGRPDHKWAVPWDDLTEDQQRYDIGIMAALPNILADGGVTLTRSQD